MIARMNKLSLLIYHIEYDDFLLQLRELGVVHVSTKQQGEADESLQAHIAEQKEAKELLQQIELLTKDSKATPAQIVSSYPEATTQYREVEQLLQQALLQRATIAKDIAILEPWGDFAWSRIQQLQEAGWYVQFFSCIERQFDESWVTEKNAIVINSDKGKVNFITCNATPVEIEAEKVVLPSRSLSELLEAQTVNEAEILSLTEKREATGLACKAIIEEETRRLQTNITFKQVKLSGEGVADNTLLLLEGWVPEADTKTVEAFLQSSSAYYEMRPAEKEDNAPIKLKNNWLTRMYEAITQMYGMPEYGEFDPTPLIAPFFTLFFAFCMGDAGYGLVLILLGFYLKGKMSKDLAGMMNLVITLGIATTVLGAIFGTFFGASLVESSWVPESLRAMMITGKVNVAGALYDKPMVLALVIGVIHILVAMLVKAIGTVVRYGWKASISNWAWLLLIVGSIATGGLSAIEKITPEMSKTAFMVIGGISAIGIYLLNDVKRNIFVNIGSGLWDTYNMATGLLGDVLSYVRLYALGLAGAMLGAVFNDMAFMINIDIASAPIVGDVLTWLFCGIILIAGHALNIAMCCLSSFVHPLRLTFVEYFKNVGYVGKGEQYKPFSENGK